MPGSPAETAGLQPGQVITAVNGEAVTNPAAVVQAIAAHAPGDTITLAVTSPGQDAPQTVTVTLGADPYQPERPWLGVMLGGIERYQYRYEYEPSPNMYQPPAVNSDSI